MLAVFGRPDTWNWLLMFHLLAAFVLLGASFVVSGASIAAARAADRNVVTMLRAIAFRTNLALVLPGFIAVIVLGAALADKEYPGDPSTPGWLDSAWRTTEAAGVVGGILLTLLQWWVVRRARAGETGGWQAQIASYLAPLVFAVLLVVFFLMTGKPG
jgi:hypothetical protein